MMDSYQKFGQYYDLIYDSFINYALDCDLLEMVFEKYCENPPRTILDIGCGTGSHAIEFAKRGYEVSGIDLSPMMISQANDKANDARVAIDFRTQDMRAIDMGARFDIVLCWFGGFGYLHTADDLQRFFQGLERVLHDSSIFIFEFWHTGGLRPGIRNWQRVNNDENGTTVIRLSESKYDDSTGILSIPMEFYVLDDREVRDGFTEVHKLRCYSLDEMELLLGHNGLELITTYDRDKSTVQLANTSDTTFRILIIASKSNRFSTQPLHR